MFEPDKEDSKIVEQPLERAFSERLERVAGSSERRTIASLARELKKLPADRVRVALEVSAQIAQISLGASSEFLRAVPEAARLLEASELRRWSEMGRRLTMADAETGASFFASSLAELAAVPADSRASVFDICTWQMALSAHVAVDTLRRAGGVARTLPDDTRSLQIIFEVAIEIARHSTKHSHDFLAATPEVITCFRDFDQARMEMMRAAVNTVKAFAVRSGGVAADAWSQMPTDLQNLDSRQAQKLLSETESFLESGGTAALGVMAAGGEVLRVVPGAFDAWINLLHQLASDSSSSNNSSLVPFTRTSKTIFRALAAGRNRNQAEQLSRRVVAVVGEIATHNQEAALDCFRSAPQALRTTSIEQYERWAREGLRFVTGDTAAAVAAGDTRAGRSYYALETRASITQLRGGIESSHGGLALDDVAPTLRLYIEALTGRQIEIASFAAVPTEARINDGRTIHLPSNIAQFKDEVFAFRFYKVLAAHAAGQIEFGTHERDSVQLQLAYESIGELYAEENTDARDAFSLAGYINDPTTSERALAPEEEARRARAARRKLPAKADYRAVLRLFPHPELATRIFGTLENKRIDGHLRATYRGLRRDLDLIQAHLRASRPAITDLPVTLVPFELLFQITLCGGALADARAAYAQIVSELESIVIDYLMPTTSKKPLVADTLMATNRVYALFQSVVPNADKQQPEPRANEAGEDGEASANTASETSRDVRDTDERRRQQQQEADARELFNQWANNAEAQTNDVANFDQAEQWTTRETIEQTLEPGETAYLYDEWDRALLDHRVGWCRVIEKRGRKGDRTFVELTRSRYRGIISSIKHSFQMLKPESLQRVTGELDGEDFDLNRVIDFVIDRRAAPSFKQASERLYTKRLRRERDTAVAFLLDQSSSTARTISQHPLQPYTHPGRRIIDIEKEGLVVMSEALEAVGDCYAIYGFTSEGRRNVRFNVVKEFNEHFDFEIERRIGGITFHHNTRLGTAVRHAAMRLSEQEARTRLLIILTDGRPYDHDYGDARYAREDTREALRNARLDGITPFCITIDRDSEQELRDLYGEVGYTIIDNVLRLPERLPAIYRRLTT